MLFYFVGLVGKQHDIKAPGSLGGQEVEHEEAVCLCRKSQWSPELYQDKYHQHIEGGDPFLLINAGGPHLDCCV